MSIHTIQRETQVEITVERSRFVALSFRISSASDGKSKLKETQMRFPGATHYCYAWCLREGREEFSSDGGEPPGNAGKPILWALRRFRVTNTMVVVVRYFGGKKLGIRGLIEAYGEAARMVLEKSGLIEYRRAYLFLVAMSLPHRNWFINRLLAITGKQTELVFGEDETATFRVLENEKEQVEAFLRQMQREGKILKFEFREG